MKFFLKLKHWQIFIIWLIAVTQFQAFINTDFWLVPFVIYVGLLFGWIYSIGKHLNNNNAELTKKLNIFSVLYLVAILPFGLNFHYLKTQTDERVHWLILIFCGIIAIVSFIKVALISSKSLKQKEKSGDLTFGNYALEFFLILYMIIGVWVIQPKLNKLLVSAGSTKGNTRI